MRKTARSLAIASILALSACSVNFSDNIVTSKVGNITKEEFYTTLKQQTGAFVLHNMLVEKVLTKNYKIDEEEVIKKYDEYKKQYGNQFKTFLSSQLMSEDTLKRNIRIELATKKAIEKNISNKELQKEYQPQLRINQILVQNEKTTQMIKDELAKGATFEELAKKYSEDVITKEKGGDLGYMGPGNMSTEVKEVAYKLKKGEISESFKTPQGYQFIKVTDIKERMPSDKEKEKIITGIVQKKLQDPTFIKNLQNQELRKANINVQDKNLEEFFNTSQIEHLQK